MLLVSSSLNALSLHDTEHHFGLCPPIPQVQANSSDSGRRLVRLRSFRWYRTKYQHAPSGPMEFHAAVGSHVIPAARTARTPARPSAKHHPMPCLALAVGLDRLPTKLRITRDNRACPPRSSGHCTTLECRCLRPTMPQKRPTC